METRSVSFEVALFAVKETRNVSEGCIGCRSDEESSHSKLDRASLGLKCLRRITPFVRLSEWLDEVERRSRQTSLWRRLALVRHCG